MENKDKNSPKLIAPINPKSAPARTCEARCCSWTSRVPRCYVPNPCQTPRPPVSVSSDRGLKSFSMLLYPFAVEWQLGESKQIAKQAMLKTHTAK